MSRQDHLRQNTGHAICRQCEPCDQLIPCEYPHYRCCCVCRQDRMCMEVDRPWVELPCQGTHPWVDYQKLAEPPRMETRIPAEWLESRPLSPDIIGETHRPAFGPLGKLTRIVTTGERTFTVEMELTEAGLQWLYGSKPRG